MTDNKQKQAPLVTEPGEERDDNSSMNKTKLEEAINIILSEAKSLSNRENPTIQDIEDSRYLLEKVKELNNIVKLVDLLTKCKQKIDQLSELNCIDKENENV